MNLGILTGQSWRLNITQVQGCDALASKVLCVSESGVVTAYVLSVLCVKVAE